MTKSLPALITVGGDTAINRMNSKLKSWQNWDKVYASFDNGERICINRSYKKSFNEYLQRMMRMS